MSAVRPKRSGWPSGRTAVEGQAVAAEVFRPARWLRALVLGALAHWTLVFFALVFLRGAPDQAFAGAAFFILFFTLLGLFYANHAIEVTDDALIVRGLTSFRSVPLSDVVGVDVRRGLLQTSYSVAIARRAPIRFTSLLAQHRRLAQLVVERAGLSPH